MKNINQSQESLSVYKIRKLLQKTRIRISRKIRNSYTINEKEIEMTMGITREKNVTIKVDTTFRFKSLLDHENEYVGSYDCNRTITKERVINIYVKKDDRDETELWNYRKRNINNRIENQTVKKIL